MVDTKKERKKLTGQYDKIAKKFKEAKEKGWRAMEKLSDEMRPIGIELAKLDEIDHARGMVEKWEKRKGRDSPVMIEKWENTLGVLEGAY